MTGEKSEHIGGGVTFAKLFPNPDEPYRGIFVADQLAATSNRVTWSVVAPVPLVPRFIARIFGKPWVKGTARYEGLPVSYPRYPVLPKRLGYATVAPLIAFTARGAFERACRDVDARFVHLHDLYPSGAGGRRLCDKAGLPYVVTVHGLDLYSNLENPRWRREIRATVSGAAAIICVGERLARDCVAELDADPDRVVIIPNTYDAERFVFSERESPAGPLRLVTLGRLSHEKGHDVLVRSVALLAQRGVDVRLTVAGDGPERATLEALAADLGLEGRVRFTGTLLGKEAPKEFAAADMFVLPSRQEGFGVALIEAMATGLVVVATRSGGPEGIVGPDDGVLVEPGDAEALADAVLSLSSRLQSYDRAGIARRTADRYTPGKIGSLLGRLYAEVLSGDAITGNLASAEGEK